MITTLFQSPLRPRNRRAGTSPKVNLQPPLLRFQYLRLIRPYSQNTTSRIRGNLILPTPTLEDLRPATTSATQMLMIMRIVIVMMQQPTDIGPPSTTLPGVRRIPYPAVGPLPGIRLAAPGATCHGLSAGKNNPKIAKVSRVRMLLKGLKSALFPSGPSQPVSAQESPFAGVISSPVTTITTTSTPTILGRRYIGDDAPRDYGALCPVPLPHGARSTGPTGTGTLKSVDSPYILSAPTGPRGDAAR